MEGGGGVGELTTSTKMTRERKSKSSRQRNKRGKEIGKGNQMTALRFQTKGGWEWEWGWRHVCVWGGGGGEEVEKASDIPGLLFWVCSMWTPTERATVRFSCCCPSTMNSLQTRKQAGSWLCVSVAINSSTDVGCSALLLLLLLLLLLYNAHLVNQSIKSIDQGADRFQSNYVPWILVKLKTARVMAVSALP